MRTLEPPKPEQEKRTAGEDFVKKIGPAGCILFLALAILVAAICLTAGSNPVPGYESPHDTAYWATHTQALAAELNENVLPCLEWPAGAEAAGDTVTITTREDDFVAVRGALLHYFDESLFTFEKGDVS